jgi:hypothetical protein
MNPMYKGSIYLIDPTWQGDADNQHEAVVEPLKWGRGYIKMAIELWQLAGNKERSARLEELSLVAFERENRSLDAAELDEMISLLGGLEEALLRNVVDSNWQVPGARLAELRGRCDVVDLSDDNGHIASNGVSEGMSSVCTLRAFLEGGRDRRLHLALD